MTTRLSILQSHINTQPDALREGTVAACAASTTLPRFSHNTLQAGKHRGFGKVILFGEHFVVYKVPAVVCAVNEFTDCQIERTPGVSGWRVVDSRPAVPGYITSKAAEQRAAHDLVFDHLKIDLSNGKGVTIYLGGPLSPTSGIGASASNVTALARALSDSYSLGLSEEQVNQAAFVGEGGYHGTPSGIDNTAATYGGLLSFKRTEGAPEFARIETKSSAYLVVVSTGITASTTEVVGEVRRRREENGAWFAKVEAAYTALYAEALPAIRNAQWDVVGRLMDRNHAILRDDLNLSIPQLEVIVAAAKKAGALGAKLSGTGRGGIAVALCATTAQQRIVADAVRKLPEAKFVWEYSIGGGA